MLVLLTSTLPLVGCSHYSCYGVQFNRIDFLPRGAISVTHEDEATHPSLAWVARRISAGVRSDQVDGRGRFDDFLAYAHERNLDLSGVSPPTFVVRGVVVAIRGVNNCLL